MALYSKNKKILFVHVPKTGGTSIQKWLIDNTDSRPIKGKHWSFENLQKRHNLEVDYSFGVVRNPWDYVVSWYFFKKDRAIRTLENGPKNKGKMTKEYALKVLEDFDKGIEHFIKNLQPTLQTDRIGKVNDILYFENLDNDFCKIQDKFKCFVPLQRLNVSQREKNYRTYYTNYTKQLVYEKYKQDIEILGYSY